MRWQDIVISICQVGFLAALMPSIRNAHKPAVATSVMYATFLTIISVSLLTLHLWLSSISAFAGVPLWLILAYQKSKRPKTKS